MAFIDRIHTSMVHSRRVRVLADHFARLLPPDASVLDVGSGDGLLAKLVSDRRPDLKIEGIDLLVRPQTHIPVRAFDGIHIDCPDRSFDAVMFVDVLHHTDDPEILIAEAARVARKCIVIKDHTRNGWLAGPTLRFMDHVGNAKHGVPIPGNYWPKWRWDEMIARRGFKVEQWVRRIGLYPWWSNWWFGRGLHFIARLGVAANQ